PLAARLPGPAGRAVSRDPGARLRRAGTDQPLSLGARAPGVRAGRSCLARHQVRGWRSPGGREWPLPTTLWRIMHHARFTARLPGHGDRDVTVQAIAAGHRPASYPGLRGDLSGEPGKFPGATAGATAIPCPGRRHGAWPVAR